MTPLPPDDSWVLARHSNHHVLWRCPPDDRRRVPAADASIQPWRKTPLSNASRPPTRSEGCGWMQPRTHRRKSLSTVPKPNRRMAESFVAGRGGQNLTAPSSCPERGGAHGTLRDQRRRAGKRVASSNSKRCRAKSGELDAPVPLAHLTSTGEELEAKREDEREDGREDGRRDSTKQADDATSPGTPSWTAFYGTTSEHRRVLCDRCHS